MENAPKSLRLQIGIFGRTNVGKSSFLNLITSQDVSIVSAQPGTTTDIVEKTMEFRPVGPVVFLDTAGVDDDSRLSTDRVKRTAAIFGRADVFVVLTEAGQWGRYEESLCGEANARGVPLIIVVNKTDISALTDAFRERLVSITPNVMGCSCAGGRPGASARTCANGADGTDGTDRETVINTFKNILVNCISENPAQPAILVKDLLPPGGLAILVVPIDTGAPQGRLILPQVQTIRDILDGSGAALVVKDGEYADALAVLSKRPDLVICDSQAVQRVATETPEDIRLTTFSILFARFKGELDEFVRGTSAINTLKKGDRVLVAESCAHHAGGDDIGRVKIPRMLRERTGLGDGVRIDFCNGRDYPDDLDRYSLIIHCGACMLTRREMLSRIGQAKNKNVPITNYGLAISYFQGVLDRVVKPFLEKV